MNAFWLLFTAFVIVGAVAMVAGFFFHIGWMIADDIERKSKGGAK